MNSSALLPAAPPAARFLVGEPRGGVDVFPFAGGTLAIATRAHPTAERRNQDALVAIPVGDHAGVIAVADGCGGMADGDIASMLAVHLLADCLASAEELSPTPHLRAAILDGVERADQAIADLGSGAATTIAIVEIDHREPGQTRVRPYHVGDSSIVLMGGRGRIKHQTMSHSPVGYAVQSGMLDEYDALRHEHRHIVSNVLGEEAAHIEVGPSRMMACQDTLLVASDGLTDNLSTDEIIRIVRKGPLDRALENLLDVTLQRMQDAKPGELCKPDDVSAMLFRRGR